MRIGVVAPPWLPIPPNGYGGTEQVIHDLCAGLARCGHEVVLATVGTSRCPVTRRARRDRPDPHMGTALPEAAHVLWAYDQLLRERVDVVHDHTITGPVLAAWRTDLPPVATTHHGPFDADAVQVFQRVAQQVAVVAISHAQRSHAPTVPVRRVIHHGVDTTGLRPGPGGDGLLFLGRMSPDKGVHRAVLAARAAGRPLVIAAKMWEQPERDYFEDVVRPLLSSDVTVLEGGVGAEQRAHLLGHSLALLNPIGWREPFGLVMAEALACGTPVIAYPQGAAPEIVDHGATGYLVRDVAQMAAAVGHVDRLSRAACRAAAVERFSTERMVTDYADLFADLVHRRQVRTITAVPHATTTAPRSPSSLR